MVPSILERKKYMKITDKNGNCTCSSPFVLGFFGWLGGAVYTANQPGMNFWDGVIWLYYVGRYIAVHFGAG